MKKPRVQQRTERRISAALRLVMVAVLLLAQIALVIVLSDLLKQRMALAYTVLQLLAGVVAMRIWSRPGATSYKMGWIILVLFVPVVGLILYLLWNGDRPSKRLSLKKPVPIEEPLAQQELARTNLEKLRQTAPQWYPLAAYLSGKGFDLYRNTALRYLPTGEAYLEDMLTTLDTAQRFIFLEYFIMAEGEIWDRLSDILCRKSRQGVEVKLIFDDFGSMMRMPNEKIDALQDAGVEVRVFNPVHHYVNRLYFNYRDHRKILVIDGKVGFTGGVNLADEYINHIEKYGCWKDAAVMLAGEGVRTLTILFLEMWSIRRESEFDKFLSAPPYSVPAKGFAAPYGDCPLDGERVGEMVYIDLLNRAKRYIHIMTPYLILDGELETALKFAAERGVDVHLILPHVPDKKFAYALAKTHYKSLLDSGVKISEWLPGFVHAKVFVVDDSEAVVGTINLDYRSLYHHFENAVWMKDTACIPAIEKDFQKTLEFCRDVEPTRESIWEGKTLLHLAGVLLKVIAPLL